MSFEQAEIQERSNSRGTFTSRNHSQDESRNTHQCHEPQTEGTKSLQESTDDGAPLSNDPQNDTIIAQPKTRIEVMEYEGQCSKPQPAQNERADLSSYPFDIDSLLMCKWCDKECCLCHTPIRQFFDSCWVGRDEYIDEGATLLVWFCYM